MDEKSNSGNLRKHSHRWSLFFFFRIDQDVCLFIPNFSVFKFLETFSKPCNLFQKMRQKNNSKLCKYILRSTKDFQFSYHFHMYRILYIETIFLPAVFITTLSAIESKIFYNLKTYVYCTAI